MPTTQRYAAKESSAPALRRNVNWTNRQVQVLDLLRAGKTNPQIAAELGLSLDGAKWHVSEVMSRLGVESRDEAAAYWRHHQSLPSRLSRAAKGFSWAPLLKVSLGAGAALVAVGVAAGLVVVANNARTDEERPAGVTPASPTQVQTVPAATDIDTSLPGWDTPFLEAWRAKPRFDQVISGIAVGPTVSPQLTLCAGQPIVPLEPSAATGTALEITPAYLPSAASYAPDSSRMDNGSSLTGCGNKVLINDGIISIPADADAAQRILGGESWFDVRHGSVVRVSRIQLGPDDAPALISDIPAEHWEAGQVGGHSAAIGHPVLDAGLGDGMVIVWDETNRVLTTVQSHDLSLDELLKISEGIVS